MKIGINATFLYDKPTGACQFTRDISRAMSVIHRDILLFSPLQDDLMANLIYKVPGAIRGSLRLSNNLLRFFYINTVLPLLCKLNGIDVLYCPIMEFPFIPLTPLVVHVHDLHFIHFPSEFGLAAQRMRFSIGVIKNAANRITVSSEFVKKELIESGYVKEDKVDVVPLAYNDRIFRPQPVDIKENFLRKYSLPERYILFVSSLFPYKNLKTLIAAFLKIKHRIPHCLVVVGRKEFSGEPLVKDERILYMDYVQDRDIASFYSFADVFVYPSLREGFGIPPLEAMACGTPVIASNRGSIPEVVGDAGILFDPEDSATLSELILKVLSNERLRKEMIEKGLNHVKKFSWEKTAEGILKSCERALRER